MGQTADTQRPWFQAALALMKWPPIVLLVFILALFLVVSRKVRPKVDLLVLSLFPVGFLLFQMAVSRISTGERHFLPVYPFVLLLCGAAWEFAQRTCESSSHPRRRPRLFCWSWQFF